MHWTESHCKRVQEEYIDECQNDASELRRWWGGKLAD